jgi:hypothetical protein
MVRYPLEKAGGTCGAGVSRGGETPARWELVADGACGEQGEGDLGGFCSAGSEFAGGAPFCLRLDHVDMVGGAGHADLLKEVAVTILFEDDDTGLRGGRIVRVLNHGHAGIAIAADDEHMFGVRPEDVDAVAEVLGAVVEGEGDVDADGHREGLGVQCLGQRRDGDEGGESDGTDIGFHGGSSLGKGS